MLAKTGLLIVSNPKHIGKLLIHVQKNVKNTLYIQLLSALADPLGSFHPNIFASPPKLSRTIFSIYSQATKYCNNLDVRVLLSGIKTNVAHIQTQKPIDVIIFDKKYTQDEIDNFIKLKILNISKEHEIVNLDSEESEEIDGGNEKDDNVYKHVVLGGTFDKLHLAHKLLLSDAILRASKKVTVGVTEENMTHGKLLWELIEEVDLRVNNVTNFVKDICPELEYDVCKIADPFGPAIVDPTMELIIVSEETIKGGEKINQIRRERNLPELKMVPIPFIDEPNPEPNEETKVSSSNLRRRLLGTLLNPIEKKSIPDRPYVIGLTGGIASGKSGVAEHLENLDVLIINCDLIGHSLYKKGHQCYKPVIDHFGPQIVAPDGEIDRKSLGSLVFKKPEELQKLNEIMWPAIVKEIFKMITKSGKEIVAIEAAILFVAGWQRFCHEVWTTIVPKEEAIQRLITRNNLTEDQAKNRIASQPPNTEYVKSSNVIFCPLWSSDYTKLQVLRAWDLLQTRLPK